jgi:APA family basic amino acid/polyamine antiporter
VLYIAVAVVLTGMQPYSTFLGEAAPVAKALRAVGLDRVQQVVTIGALTGMVSSLLVYQYGQTRIWYAMSRDGLLPKAFAKVHPRYRIPHISTWVAGLVVGIPAGLLDIGTLADLSSIGTLFAFVLVSLAVLILRRTQPERPRSFRVPFVKVVAPLSIASCLFLMLGLPLENWVRLFIWLAIGLAIYFGYSRKHSQLRKDDAAAAA